MKHPKNVPGRYYVDCDGCLSHALCVHVAPGHFRIDEHGWEAYIFKQPESPEEDTCCREALEACPMAAIHDDGEVNA
jgi:ferredoxin